MYMQKRIGMIIPAAGIGSRMGNTVKKQFLTINGKAILRRTLENLVVNSICDEIVLVVGIDEVEVVNSALTNQWNIKANIKVVSGGQSRQESVHRGLNELEHVDFVFIHDGVRPFAKSQWLSEMIDVFEESDGLQGLSVGRPVTDTLKEVSSETFVVNTLNRATIWSVQTPQLFSYEVIKVAHVKAEMDHYQATDDASLIEREGGKVKVVYFGDENIKITTPFDLIVAETIINQKTEV